MLAADTHGELAMFVSALWLLVSCSAFYMIGRTKDASFRSSRHSICPLPTIFERSHGYS